MTTNDNIIERAQAIASKKGGDWADHLLAARREAAQQPLQKIVRKSNSRVESLRKKAALATQLRHLPGSGSVDPDHRIELGEISTELGRIRLSVSRDSFEAHGVSVLLEDIDSDLRQALVSTSAAFAAAILDSEQSEQKTIVGIVMDAVMRRHQFLTAKVKELLRRERIDA